MAQKSKQKIKTELFKNSFYKGLIAVSLIFILGLALGPFSNAQLFQPRGKSTVLILVEQNLLNLDQEYNGLASQNNGLSRQTLVSRIERYAQTVQSRLEKTDTVIIPIPSSAPAHEISRLIANLTLFENDAIEGNVSGLVLIGDLPLPVVTEGGVEFTSVYPYTDHIVPRFKYDEEAGQYVQVNDTLTPELWHGVVSFTDPEGYASFFDKVELSKRPEFSPEKQLLVYANPQEEAASLNEDLVAMYGSYLSLSEERAYNRYSKDSLRKAKTAFASTLQANRSNSDDEEVQNAYQELTNLVGSETEQYTPDIYVSQQLSSYIKPASALLSGFFNRAIPQLESMGRYYFSNEEIVLPFNQISVIDAYQETYFRALNETIKDRVIEIAEQVQEEISLQPGLYLVGSASAGARSVDLTPQVLINHRLKTEIPLNLLVTSDSSLNTQLLRDLFLNGSWLNLLYAQGFALEPQNILVTFPNSVLVNRLQQSLVNYFNLGELHINGTPAANIETPDQCRVYRGSSDGQIVETIRNYPQADPDAPLGETQLACYLPWEAGESKRFLEDPLGCDPFLHSYVRDDHRPRLVTDISDSQTTHEACFEYRTPKDYFNSELELQPATQVASPSSIILASIAGGTVTLADLLQSLNRNVNLADHQEWSALLANQVGEELTVTITPNLQNQLSQEVTLNVNLNGYGQSYSIDSLIVHDDPNNQILNQQLQEAIAFDLPVDNGQWVSFAGQDGQNYRLKIPNLFQVGSQEELTRTLRQIETTFTRLSDQNFTGRLTGLISNSEIWNSDYTKLAQADNAVLDELFTWKNSGLNTKYKTILEESLTRSNRFGEFWERGIAEVTYLNLQFQDGILKTDFPEVSSNTNLAATDLPIRPELDDDIVVDASKLAAASQCSQYQTSNQAVAFSDYISYLDCWVENEVLASIDSLASFPNQFGVDFSNENVPQPTEVVSQIQMTPDYSQLYEGEETVDLPISITLIGVSGNRLVGSSNSVKVTVGNNAEFSSGSKSQEYFTARGNVEGVIKVNTQESSEVTITALVGDVSQSISVPIVSRPNLRVQPSTITAGNVASLSLSYQVTDTRESLPTEIELESERLSEINNSYELGDNGELALGITAPKQAGEAVITLSSPGRPDLKAEVNIIADSPQRIFISDRLQPKVTKSESQVKLSLFDQYGNIVQNVGTASIRQIAGQEFAVVDNQEVRPESGVYTINLNQQEQTGVVSLELSLGAESYVMNFLSTQELTLPEVNSLSPHSLFAQVTHNLSTSELASLANSWLKGPFLQTLTTENTALDPTNANDPFYGTTQSYNQLLKVAAGNPIGLSYLKNTSPTALTFGDPTFTLSQNKRKNVSQYSSDIGKLLATTSNNITHLETIDNQVALGTERGEVITITAKEQPVLLSTLPLGIQELTWWQPERGEDPVLLVTTQEQCSVMQGCIFSFRFNNQGKLVREALGLQFTGKPQSVNSIDLTQDGREDLLIVDEEGKILIFTNIEEGGERTLQKTGIQIANAGQVVDSTANQAGFFAVAVTPGVQVSSNAPQFSIDEQKFAFLNQVSNITSATAQISDDNGNPLQLGDKLSYRLNIRALTELNNVTIALPLGSGYKLDEASLSCGGCELVRSPDRSYRYLLTGVDLPAANTVIEFKADVQALKVTNPQIQFVQDIADYPADGKVDIAVTIPGNQFRTIYYSSRNQQNNIVYLPYQEPLTGPEVEGSAAEQLEELRTRQSSLANEEDLSARVASEYEEFTTRDSDGDGLVDSLGSGINSANRITKKVADGIEDFFCSTGCLALPVNYAFLVDGLSAPPFTGVPVFGISGVPPYVYFGTTALFSGTYFRNYVSPTLTGEVAMALCYGPYPIAGCSAFQLFGLHNFGDLCGAINSGIKDLMQGAVDLAQKGVEGALDETGLAAAGVTVNLSNAGSGPPGIDVKTTVKVPGFPDVLTNWLSAQWMEVVKVVDLPDLNIIYPDFSGAFSFGTKAKAKQEDVAAIPEPDTLSEEELQAIEDENLREFARDLNEVDRLLQAGLISGQQSVAATEVALNDVSEYFNEIAANSLLKIEEEHFNVQYPYLDPKEIHQFMNQLIEWYANAAKEYELAMNSWGCYADVFENLADEDVYDLKTIEQAILDGGSIKAELRQRIEESETPSQKQARQACVELALAWGGLSATVNANLEILADYLDLPYLIVEIDSFEAKVAGAVQGYIDEFNDAIVVWLNSNTERIKAWQNTVKTLRDLWDEINFLLSLSLDYTKQCSDCRTDRFSNFAALLDFFITIPDPPVFELPKLPNITLDFSDVRPGATLKVPTFSFTPVPVELPTLPQLVLPKAPPVNLTAQLQEFGFILNARLPEPPNFEDLAALLELPDLPEIQLPKLPVLPLPPDVEQLNFSVMAELKATLELVSELLRIVCLVEKAGFPVPESALKEKVEQITARPITPVLPIDIAAGIGFELPKLPTFRYLKELKIVGHLALNLNAELLIDAIDGIVNEINQFSTDFGLNWNESIRNFNQENNSLLDLNHDFGEFNFSFTPEEQQLLREFNLDLTQPNEDEIRRNLEGSLYPRLFAQNVNDQGQSQPGTGVDLQVQTPPGLYVQDEQLGQAAPAMEFVPAALDQLYFDFADLDDDRDLDLVYAIGKEVFLKENLNNQADSVHLRSRARTLDYEELTQSLTEPVTSEITFVNSQKRASLIAPELAEGQIAVVEVAPSGETRQANVAKYVLTTDADLLSGLPLVDDELSWQLYTGNARSIDLGEISISKSSSTELYFQAISSGSEISLPHLEAETTYYVSIVDSNNQARSRQLFTISQLRCGDTTPPRANGIGGKSEKVIVYEPIELDLSVASDSSSSVVGYYIDEQPDVDTNGDGITDNDRDLRGDASPDLDSDFDGNPENDSDVPRFRIRGYDQPGTYQLAAGLVDESGNETIVRIDVEVTLPDITLTQVDSQALRGSISPAKPNIPIQVIRDRSGDYVQIAPEQGTEAILTDENGQFLVTELENRETITITERETDIIAEIGLETGAIIHEENFATRVIPHTYANNSRIEIVNSSNQKVTEVKFRPTGLNDVQYWESEPDLSQFGPIEQDYVYVWDTDDSDNYRWQFLANDDPGFPGGAVLTKDGVRTVIVTPDGNIFAEGPVNFVLQEVEDPFGYQPILVRDGLTVVAKILITVEAIEIVPYTQEQNQGNRGSFELPNEPVTPQIPFSDLATDDPDAEIVRYLQERYVVEGRIQEGERVAALDSLMKRSEYVKTLLTMMCIQPREGAYREPNVFADIIQIPGVPMPWYYPYTKEGYLQGFVTGYEGSIDPVTGLPIFLPENNISVAEAAKVVLEVLESQGIVDLSNLPTTEVWYDAYMVVAQDLSSILLQPSVGENFILTSQEAIDPTRPITRREFFRIVDRVLSFTNCLELDDDADGLPNYFEQRFNLNEGDDDPDQDRLTNLQEYRLGTNPLDPDTDDGGIDDGTEVFRGSDPLDPADDLPGEQERDRGGLVEDVPCLTCPCQYRVDYGSDLHYNDEVFAVIKDRNNAIIQRSNSVIPRTFN